MFASNVETGERLATPTIVCAARWNTESTSYSPSARSISAPSQTSPTTTFTRASVPSSASADTATESRRSTVVRAPRCSRAFTSQLPNSP